MLAQEYRHEFKLHTTPKGRVIPKITASGRRTSGSGCTGSRTVGHPTPSCEGSAGEISEDLERVGNKFRNRKTGRVLQTNLATDTLMLCGYPTPNTPSGGPNTHSTDTHTGGMDLEGTASLAGHPTCSARDWKDTPGMSQTGTNPDGSERSRLDMLPRVSALASLGAATASTATSTGKTAGYRLNPGFSLWLMIGIPSIVDAWASCGVRAMLSCRPSRRSS